MRNDGDAALVQAARDGDREAYATLLIRHGPTLRALCRRALGDPAAAEDAAQEAALQAMLSLDHLRRPEQFGSWLARIGLNICRRWLRERSRFTSTWSWESLSGGRLAPECADPTPGPEARAEAADLANRVRRAVADLPPGQRSAVALFYLSGLTLSETADTLGVEVGAVKTRLHKARRTLRRQLVDDWMGESHGEDMMAKNEVDARLVEMRVADMRRVQPEGEGQRRYVAILQEVGGDRQVPIWIGEFEGMAIALHLEDVQVPRPMTFTFATNLLRASGAELREVRISRLVEQTFYAQAVVEGPGGHGTVDARPSDAINLALLTGAPIYVDPTVLEAMAARPDPSHNAALGAAEGPAEIVAELMRTTWAGRNAPPEKER